jgi:hypothetical protein
MNGIHIIPYESVGTLRFGESSPSECIHSYGPPEAIRTNAEGVEEYHYKSLIARFDAASKAFRECTILPETNANIAGIDVTWDDKFLASACRQDGSAKNVFGFVVLRELGIAVTGIHDGDRSQLAVTVFSKGDFDELLVDAPDFVK